MNNMTPHHTPSRVQRLSFVSFGKEEKHPEPVQEELLLLEEEILAPEIAAPVHIITETELQTARNDGYEEGYKTGYSAAEAKADKEALKREEDTKSVMEIIASRITIAGEEHASYIKKQQEIMGNLAIAIARKVAGDAIKAEPYAVVESILRECLALIIGQPKVTITASANMHYWLKQRIDSLRPLLPGFTGELVIEENAALSDNDCRVEWKSGHAERDTAKLWSEIETIIAKTRKL